MKRWPIIGALSLIAVGAGLFALISGPGDTAAEPTRALEIGDVYDPVRAGEPIPDDFHQLLSRDAIRPIYDPQFVATDESVWTETTIVIGVEVNGDARAYSVALLGRREMVNDTIGGEPLLVTW